MNQPGRTTILVVEDETLIRMHGADILENAGFEVLEAANADEAVAILHKHGEVRLLFSDVDMPGTMNGLQLATLVHERWPAIRLLLTSGQHHLREEALPDHGKFVPKPWSHEDLISKIKAALQPQPE